MEDDSERYETLQAIRAALDLFRDRCQKKARESDGMNSGIRDDLFAILCSGNKGSLAVSVGVDVRILQTIPHLLLQVMRSMRLSLIDGGSAEAYATSGSSTRSTCTKPRCGASRRSDDNSPRAGLHERTNQISCSLLFFSSQHDRCH